MLKALRHAAKVATREMLIAVDADVNWWYRRNLTSTRLYSRLPYSKASALVRNNCGSIGAWWL